MVFVRRPRRIFLDLITALSLMLCAVTMGLWIRSHRAADPLTLESRPVIENGRGSFFSRGDYTVHRRLISIDGKLGYVRDIEHATISVEGAADFASLDKLINWESFNTCCDRLGFELVT